MHTSLDFEYLRIADSNCYIIVVDDDEDEVELVRDLDEKDLINNC